MHSWWSSCLEVLLQLPGWQVELVEALQERAGLRTKAVILDLHHAPRSASCSSPLDHNHLPRDPWL